MHQPRRDRFGGKAMPLGIPMRIVDVIERLTSAKSVSKDGQQVQEGDVGGLGKSSQFLFGLLHVQRQIREFSPQRRGER